MSMAPPSPRPDGHESGRTSASLGSCPAGYEALVRSAAWGSPKPRSVLVARGPDAVRFIDNFTTAAVSRLSPGTGSEGLFTDARGWVMCLANILGMEDGVEIDLPVGLAPRLREHLEHYHVRERVDLSDESGRRAHAVVAGSGARAWLAARCASAVPDGLLDHGPANLGGVSARLLRIDAYGPEGFLVETAREDFGRLVSWFENERLVRADDAAWEAARIQAGFPDAEDIPEKTLPQELDRDQRAICFSKGCYLGQETVARIHSLGHVNRRLTAVAFDPAAVPPFEVSAGDDTIGRLTSACFSPALGCGLGLGLLQAKAVDTGQPLSVGGMAARIVAVPIDAAASPPTVAPADASRNGGSQEPVSEAAGEELLLQTRRFRVVRLLEPVGEGGARHREIVRHPGSVAIVPLLSGNRVCLVEVVRVAVEETLLELPAGTLDRVESLEEAARRELAEETGYRAGTMKPLGAMWMSPGILRERMHVFLAEDLVSGPQALEPGEQIRTRVVDWEEAIAMCLDGRIDDAKTIAGLLLVAATRRR